METRRVINKTEGPTDRQTDRPDRLTCLTQTDKPQTDRLMDGDKESHKQDRRTNRQTDRQTRQTDMPHTASDRQTDGWRQGES